MHFCCVFNFGLRFRDMDLVEDKLNLSAIFCFYLEQEYTREFTTAGVC